MVKSMLTSLHSDAFFELFWESGNAKSQLLEFDDLRLQRKRKQPQRFETGNAPAEFHADPAAHYWAVYYESLYLLIQCIADRFDQPGYKMYRSLEDLLLKGCKDLPHAIELDQVKKLYSDYLRPVSNSTSIYIEVMSILSALRIHFNQT